MLSAQIILILAFCVNIFANPIAQPGNSLILRLVKRKGRGGSSGSSISSGSSGSSGTTLVSNGLKTNWGNNQYHCSGKTCGYGNYYAPTAAAAAAGYGTARYHGNSTTNRTSGAANLIVPRVYWITLGAAGTLLL
ncbi:putative GPI-anchored protein 57 [Candida viswanathii]|uniref:Putative GPI-anchored protein 57 n=1 Tax=Candida viswanathii TaxID=5486 RepID=A0A367Y049_9ASCO|nr:putative GPI-anchored protein 57 [Candida viswanathii]